METKEILKRYATAYDTLWKLGETNMLEPMTLETLNAPKSLMQMCYRWMKAGGFQGNLIDYLCYISAQHFVLQLDKFLREYTRESLEKEVSSLYEKGLVDSFSCEKFALSKVIKSNFEDARNTARLFLRFPFMVIDPISETFARHGFSFGEKAIARLFYDIHYEDYLLLEVNQ